LERKIGQQAVEIDFLKGCLQRIEQQRMLRLKIHSMLLHRWRREFRQGPGNAFPGHGQARWSEGRIAELERKIG
jgi:hypothetical protein